MPTSELTPTSPSPVDEALQQAVLQVATPDDSFTDDINHLAERTRTLAAALIARGDAFAAGEDEDPNDVEGRLTHYVWAEQAKHFLVLYRNVQLQLQTAALMVRDGAARPATVHALHLRSRQTLQRALDEWETEFAATRQQLLGDERARTKALKEYKMLRNPWPEYKGQLTVVATQARNLAEEFNALNQQVDVFADLRRILLDSIDAACDGLRSARARADEVVTFIMQQAEKDTATTPGRIANHLDELVADVNPEQQIHDYTNDLNARLKDLVDNIRVTVGADHGVLQVKDVNLQRATDQWISAEVLPQLYELWEISEQATGGFSVAINNVRNRSLLIANELRAGQEPDYEIEELSQPLYDFLARTKGLQATFDPLMNNLRRLIEADLRISSVYRPVPGFLPLPLQTGINEFTRRQGRWIEPVRDWFNATFRGIERWRGNAVREDRMSLSEKVVRVINQRQPDPANEAYTNILLTKGYIGESFLVGRDEEAAHVSRLIDNWRRGFRGAVMLTGRRLSGRSLFGEMISNRLFPNNVVRLAPRSVISVKGRRMTTTGNLADALAFVQKHSLQSQPMVWIDDLELWWDKDTSLGENVRALSAHIDSYSTKMFYLVATTNAMYDHLNRFRDLDRVFQAEVNLDTFSVLAMQQAIRIRHGATHKLLVDPDGEPLSEAAFDRRIARIHRAAYSNVGDSLNRWAYQVRYCDDDRVTLSQERRYNLPAFVGTDTGLLLATIFLERRTTDYHLRRQFGPAYDQRYRSVLQRLVRVGLVVRANDGSLRLRESLVTDVGRALDNNGYLNTDKL